MLKSRPSLVCLTILASFSFLALNTIANEVATAPIGQMSYQGRKATLSTKIFGSPWIRRPARIAVYVMPRREFHPPLVRLSLQGEWSASGWNLQCLEFQIVPTEVAQP